MSKTIEISQIAAALTGGEPLAYKEQEDGGLVVIAHTGQKFRFNPAEVAEKRRQLTPQAAKPTASRKPAPAKAQAKSDPVKAPAKPRSGSQHKSSR